MSRKKMIKMNRPLKKNKKNTSSSLKDSVVLITGGTGTFGKAFLDKCLLEGAEEIRIFSRDEKKQFDMAQMYKEHENVKFYLGDIRDKRAVNDAIFGVDYVFHAAALKQVPTCESFPMEAVYTNVSGSDNVLTAAIQKRVKKVVCLSTDKAVSPTSAMGMTKALMEKIAIQKAVSQNTTDVCITRFGNLIASRGSAVPLFIEQVESGLPITITDPEMTRYVMTVEDATDLVVEAFKTGRNGDLYVKNAVACKTGDLAKAVCKYLELSEDYPVEIIGARPGEKLHEYLLSDEEASRAVYRDGYYIVSNIVKNINNSPEQFYENQFRSDVACRLDAKAILELIRKVFEEGMN